jgi:multiple antibiotic resistance protein
MQDVSALSSGLEPSEILTLFIVTLGPIKILVPFAQRTKDFSAETQRAIAVRAFILATAAVVLGGLFGQSTLTKWHVPVPVLLITAGIILFAVALRQVLQQYEDAGHLADPLPASPMAAATRVVFPLVITPYGIATLIVLLAESGSATRTETILGILVAVMCLNLLAMLFGRRILLGPVLLVLQVLGAVLAVLQVALAIHFMLIGWRAL